MSKRRIGASLRGFFALFLCAAHFASASAAAENLCAKNRGAVAADMSQPVSEAFLKKAREIGVSTIIRYYDYDPPTLPQKTLRRKERDLILSRGFHVAVVFQHWNQRFSTFTRRRGKSDAERSLELAKENLQPKGGVIYFAVDGPWGREAELKKIRDYFGAVNDRLKPAGYKIGVYGSGLVCRDMLERSLAQFCWLANAKAWPDYKSYFAARKWRLAQKRTEGCGGLSVDLNIANGAESYFGQFGEER